MKCYRNELVGLIGCPVDENPTVVPIEAAFRALGMNGRYITMLVHPENLKDAVYGLRAASFLGTHITVPYKVAVLPYLDEISPEAAVMGAVNTVIFRNGKICGENTDGKGFMLSLEQNGIDPKGLRVAVFGAGGAARAIAVELAATGAKSITVLNRTKARGTDLAALLRDRLNADAEWIPFSPHCKIPEGIDLLVQATNIGLFPDPDCPDIDFSALRSDTVVCDIIPNPMRTLFLERAAECGCTTLSGFDMLVNQGAISFRLWTGKEPPLDVMKQALAAEYKQ